MPFFLLSSAHADDASRIWILLKNYAASISLMTTLEIIGAKYFMSIAVLEKKLLTQVKGYKCNFWPEIG